jgi:hypothetical protein
MFSNKAAASEVLIVSGSSTSFTAKATTSEPPEAYSEYVEGESDVRTTFGERRVLSVGAGG